MLFEVGLQRQAVLPPVEVAVAPAPPFKPLTPTPVSGWIAVSERVYRLNHAGRADPCAVVDRPLNPPPGWLDWLKAREPVDIIGKTIGLYYVPESELPSASTAAP